MAVTTKFVFSVEGTGPGTISYDESNAVILIEQDDDTIWIDPNDARAIGAALIELAEQGKATTN